MKCEKCGNDYPSRYFFATPTICKECFAKMPPEEQQKYYFEVNTYAYSEPYYLRVGFWRRVGAALLDGFIYNVLILLVLYITGDLRNIADMFSTYGYRVFTDRGLMMEFTTFMDKMVPLGLIVSFIYYSLEVFVAASPGKLLLGIQIASDDAVAASFFTLLTRFLVKHIDFIFTFLFLVSSMKAFSLLGSICSFVILIGCFFVIAARRQAFHDMIAGTAVYNRQDIAHNDLTPPGSALS